MNTIGERIRYIRKSYGLTGIAFGKLLGVTQACVSQWESRDRLSRSAMESILRVFELSEDELMADDFPNSMPRRFQQDVVR